MPLPIEMSGLRIRQNDCGGRWYESGELAHHHPGKTYLTFGGNKWAQEALCSRAQTLRDMVQAAMGIAYLPELKVDISPVSKKSFSAGEMYAVNPDTTEVFPVFQCLEVNRIKGLSHAELLDLPMETREHLLHDFLRVVSAANKMGLVLVDFRPETIGFEMRNRGVGPFTTKEPWVVVRNVAAFDMADTRWLSGLSPKEKEVRLWDQQVRGGIGKLLSQFCAASGGWGGAETAADALELLQEYTIESRRMLALAAYGA